MTSTRRPRLIEGTIQQDWTDHAACVGADPGVWFPGKGAHSDREAKRICGACPVRRDCLEHALENSEQFGIWGGLNEKERRAVKRSRRVA